MILIRCSSSFNELLAVSHELAMRPDIVLRSLYKLLTKITATQNEVALSYHRVRGIYFLAVFFAMTIVLVVYR